MSNSRVLAGLAFAVLFLGVTSCNGRHEPTSAASPATSVIAGPSSTQTLGYLSVDEPSAGLLLRSGPPSPGSPEWQADEAIYRQMSALQGTPRWQSATADANLEFPAVANAFACATGAVVTEADTPTLYALLQQIVVDTRRLTAQIKDRYPRERPFEVANAPSCAPQDEARLTDSSSYPSGHAALGYVWGEVWADLVPNHAVAIRERAYEFGQSRVICRMHYQSDVDAGRVLGAALIERLLRNPKFGADLTAAKLELARAPQRMLPEGHSCPSEDLALD